MVKTVAIAYLKYRDERPDRIEERLGRRRLAAVMRHEQHVGAQRVARRARAACARRRASMSAARSAERPAALVTFSTHDCAFGLPASGPGSGHSIANSTPSQVQRWPAAQRSACAPRSLAVRHNASCARQRREQLTHVDRLQYGRRAARVIRIGMADDERVERRLPAAKRYGTTMRSPACVDSGPGPASKSKAWRAVSTTIDEPCPMSSAVRRNAPGGGAMRRGQQRAAATSAARRNAAASRAARAPMRRRLPPPRSANAPGCGSRQSAHAGPASQARAVAHDREQTRARAR